MRVVAGLSVLAVALCLARPVAAAEAASAVPWGAQATTQVAAEERRFPSGDAELAGTLYLPRSDKPVAAIVVTHSASSPLGVAGRMPEMEVHVVAAADHAMQVSADEKISLDPKYDGTEQADSPEYIAVLTVWLARHGFIAGSA